jgi:hypothetical protein
LNNKGSHKEQEEPYFSDGEHTYRERIEIGIPWIPF